MKNTRKLLCAIMAAALLILSVAPAYAATVDWGTGKIYMGSSNSSNWGQAWISIEGLKSNSKITNIKSSKKSYIRISSLDSWHSSWQSFDDDDTSTDENHSATIYLRALKKGKSTISFKVDGKSYSKSFEVLGYVNPIKTFKITGISSSNLKSKFAKSAYASTKLKSDAKAGSIKVAAASGWKITSVSWNDFKGGNRYFDFGDSGVSSASLSIPKMKKKGEYYIWMNLINTKTKTKTEFSYAIN